MINSPYAYVLGIILTAIGIKYFASTSAKQARLCKKQIFLLSWSCSSDTESEEGALVLVAGFWIFFLSGWYRMLQSYWLRTRSSVCSAVMQEPLRVA